MTRFDDALKFILKWEGSQFTNDPDDRGGATKWGVIQVEYTKYRKSKGLPDQSVRFITMDEVTDIYRNEYWVKGASACLPELDQVMLDTAVNMGVGTAIKFLQRTLGVTATGKFDAALHTALGTATKTPDGIQKLLVKFFAIREARYRAIALGKGQAKFLKGWLNRLRDLATLCKVVVAFEFDGEIEIERTGKAFEDGVDTLDAEDYPDVSSFELSASDVIVPELEVPLADKNS